MFINPQVGIILHLTMMEKLDLSMLNKLMKMMSLLRLME